MRKILLILLLNISWIVNLAQSNEFKTYYIVGDDVNMRIDTLLSSHVLFKVNFGEELYGRRISGNWFEWTTGYDNGFVSSNFVTDETNFVIVAEKLEFKNGTTLYSLLKHYRKAGQLKKAEDISIEIINTYRLKEFPVYGESCPLYGELAFYAIVKGDSLDVNYSDKAVYNYCSRVLSESRDSLIIGFALYTLSKYHLLNMNFIESESILLKLIHEYGNHLLIPTSCQYDVERKTSLIVEVKNLAFILYNLNRTALKQHMYENLKHICFDKSTTPESKAIANDIRLKLSGQCWDEFTNHP